MKRPVGPSFPTGLECGGVCRERPAPTERAQRELIRKCRTSIINRTKEIGEDVIGEFAAGGESLLIVELPVDAAVDSALAGLFGSLGKTVKASHNAGQHRREELRVWRRGAER